MEGRYNGILTSSETLAQGSLLNPFPSLPHCSSKCACATPYEDLFPFCPLSVHTVLKAEEAGWAAGTTSPLSHTSIQKQNRSTQFPFFSGSLALYLQHTRLGRTRWEGSSPSLCPADHSAGILHSRLRLTATQGWSCRYVSLSGSLAPPVISFYDMLLSLPYSLFPLVGWATGGHTDAYIPYGKNLYYYDVNSLYPFIMKEYDMPGGTPVWHGNFHGKDLDSLYGFIEAYVECPEMPLHHTRSSQCITPIKEARSTPRSQGLEDPSPKGVVATFCVTTDSDDPATEYF
ncbi:hypothetical protein HN873_052267 [Arachis hypogaea]